MKGFMGIGFFIISLMGIYTECRGDVKYGILFREVKELKEGDPVLLDGEIIGVVSEIEESGSNKLVKVKIKEEYAEKIRKNAEFYLVMTGVRRIEIVVPEEPSEVMKSGTTVIGYPEHGFWIRKIEVGTKSIIKDTGERIERLILIEQWNTFKRELERKVKDLKEKGKEEMNKELPKLKKEAEEFYERIKEKVPEMAEGVRKYIDELFGDIKKEE